MLRCGVGVSPEISGGIGKEEGKEREIKAMVGKEKCAGKGKGRQQLKP